MVDYYIMLTDQLYVKLAVWYTNKFRLIFS
jgi:hypothetical protein